MFFVVLCNSILNPGRWVPNFLDRYQIYCSTSFEKALLSNLSFVFWFVGFRGFFQKISKIWNIQKRH